MILNRKMPSHPEILPVCLHSLSRHGASSSVSCATRDPKLCLLPLCLVPSSFRNLHHRSLGLFFNLVETILEIGMVISGLKARIFPVPSKNLNIDSS